MSTLLVALAHPDDEVGCAGTVAAHTAAGHRAVLLWLTRGEATEVFADLDLDEVAERRMAMGREAARILGAEARFLSFPDTRVHATPAAARTVARVVAEEAPDAVITWGDAWVRGMRHPDHRATGTIVRDAVTLARIGRAVAPRPPHRALAPVFTLRGRHSMLPARAVDVSDQLHTVRELGAFYRERVGWPGKDWLEDRLRRAGEAHGVPAAEVFDAWETSPGTGTRLL
ncbi:MAG: PIG-L deacetylase family protein [Gemmatimonadota bacterium]